MTKPDEDTLREFFDAYPEAQDPDGIAEVFECTREEIIESAAAIGRTLSPTRWYPAGPGLWTHPVFGRLIASDARAMGAPVPDDEQDPEPEPPRPPLSDDECPF